MARRWYVVHTYSGYENKVKTNIEHLIETQGLENNIFEILIPTEEVTELKEGGRRVTTERKVFPRLCADQDEPRCPAPRLPCATRRV